MKKQPYIQELTSTQFIIQTVPTTILVAKLDENFTILEANQEYYRLIGYTREEVWEVFGNNGYQTLHPEDRDDALESMRFQLEDQEEQVFSVKCRLVHKKDGYRVAHFRGRIGTQSGIAVLYLLITDITEHMHVVQQLEEEQAFNNRIASFTENAFFDYEVATDIMRFSGQFATSLGIPNIMKHYQTTMVDLGVITRESVEAVATRFQGGDVSHDTVTEEVEMISLAGEHLWFQCCYRPLYGESGAVERVVGQMTDITKHHERIDELSAKASRDPLSGLLNKDTTQRMIEDYLKVTSEDSHHAFLIIDLDHFKTINDNFGHLYGDGVIADVAKQLQSQFRQDDIIGRIGGDEFAVLMKRCKSTEAVYFKAKELGKALHKIYCQEDATIAISASIGISLYGKDGTIFRDLYHCADKALYTVKKTGRNNVAFYNWA